MAEYQYAKSDGSIINTDSDEMSIKMEPEKVKEILEEAFKLFPYKVNVEIVKNEKDIFHISYPKGDGIGDFYICGKGTTPGGRGDVGDLKNEQRIQPFTTSFNYVFKKKENGEKAFLLGIYQYDNQTIFCTWRVRPSDAKATSSVQIKIDSIAEAIKEGFYQQPRDSKHGGKEYVCAFKKEFLYFYLRNYDWLNDCKVSEWTAHVPPQQMSRDQFYLHFKCNLPRNLIVFGAPGTGKSYELNKKKNEFLEKYNEANFERVTFHPDYSYAHFVGTYKPVNDDEEKITYKFVPGPFTRILTEALKSGKTSDPQPFVLVIEEINRANTAAVFGDVFQLLDREGDGVSEYPIHTSEDLRKHLAKEVDGDDGDSDYYSQLYLPDNMFIWATMNSADQGVFPMDTAFKRRWEFEYIGIDKNQNGIQDLTVHLGEKGDQEVKWNTLRKFINQHLTDMEINEDKQLGPYFISPQSIGVDDEGKAEKDTDKLFIETFKDKVLMYLYEDAVKQRNKREILFKKGAKIRYSELCENFEKNGVFIFNDNTKQKVEEIFDKAIEDQTPSITGADEKKEVNEESNIGEN